MDNETAVKILVETELYKYVRAIRDIYKGEEAEKLIKDFTEDFKETVIKKYPVEDIDGLIESTLNRMKRNEKEIAD